jgi:tripeptide aminopeptidase
MRAYERLIAYTAYDTASDETSPSCPSSEKQLVFARALVQEMLQMGIDDAKVDQYGYVYGTIPETMQGAPVLGYIAHMDVVDDVPSAPIRARVIENYDGGDILLNAQEQIVLSPKDSPQLRDDVGKTLIVTDGTTLLGADDKAGIAVILTLAQRLIENPQIPHGKIRIGFTPDEEIGRGADRFDVTGFGADFAYTLDGGTFGEVEYENFNASSAVVTVTGRSFHPGSAKNRMINAQEVAMRFHSMLPAAEKPAHTEKYEGFYHLTDMTGKVEQAVLRYILRDHDAEKLRRKEETLVRTAEYLNGCYGQKLVQVQITQSYRNMAEALGPHRHLIDTAYEAVRQAGAAPYSVPVRGGTDGARLSYMGLPCPNLGTGAHNAHGRMEYAVAQEMDQAVLMLEYIARAYAKRG